MRDLDTNPNRDILVPYDDFAKLSSDSTRVQLALDLLYASFPDETCRMTALKAALGYKEPEPEEDNEEPTDPTDPTDSSDPDPTNP